MFISKAYYCYHIHKEKISNPETGNTNSNTPGKQISNFFKKLTWKWNKKRVFHAIWAILNLVILSSFFQIVSNTNLVFIFFVATSIYCSLYWMLASILFNKLFRGKLLSNL